MWYSVNSAIKYSEFSPEARKELRRWYELIGEDEIQTDDIHSLWEEYSADEFLCEFAGQMDENDADWREIQSEEYDAYERVRYVGETVLNDSIILKYEEMDGWHCLIKL